MAGGQGRGSECDAFETRADSMKNLHYLPLLLLTALTAGCDNKVEAGLQGYAEGEYVRVAAPFAGNLQRRSLQHGIQR